MSVESNLLPCKHDPEVLMPCNEIKTCFEYAFTKSCFPSLLHNRHHLRDQTAKTKKQEHNN